MSKKTHVLCLYQKGKHVSCLYQKGYLLVLKGVSIGRGRCASPTWEGTKLHVCIINFTFSTACLQVIYILAFTSGSRHGGSRGSHKVEVKATGQTRVIKLPNLPGNDYQRNKGDLWKLSFGRNLKVGHNLKFNGCVTLKNIEHVAIVSGSRDGWNIDSIVTYVGADGSFRELTHDFNVYRSIDDDGSAPNSKRFVLYNAH